MKNDYSFLKKTLLLLLLLTILSVCWIYTGDFYDKGEPREASVAVSMIEGNEWILPIVYADEMAFKPPFFHWLIAAFSLPQGEVSVFTARLPSAIAFVCLIGACFLFFGRRMNRTQALLTCLILITSFELHRSAMEARVDMLLTALIVCGLFSLFRWEEKKQLHGFPILAVLLLSCATLVKGPVGIVLPLFVFGVYLLLLKYNIFKITGKFILLAFASLLLPAVWYYLAYLQGGQEFFELVWAENFGRFFGSEVNIPYELGHEVPFYYNFIYLLFGFIPWTILLLMSLFVLDYGFKLPKLKTIWRNLISMEKVQLFSLLSAVLIVFFYCIPVSKRSVYIMPAYPFIAVFLSHYFLYLTQQKPKIIRIFSILVAATGIFVALIMLFTVLIPVANPVQLFAFFDKRTLADIAATWNALNAPYWFYLLIFFIILVPIFVLFHWQKRRNNLKILFAAVAVYFVTYLAVDAAFIPAFKNGVSIKPFAKEVEAYKAEYGDIYVLMIKHSRLFFKPYGMNFYLKNSLKNFVKELPEIGLLLMNEADYEPIYAQYADLYDFELLKKSDEKSRDTNQILVLYSIRKKN